MTLKSWVWITELPSQSARGSYGGAQQEVPNAGLNSAKSTEFTTLSLLRSPPSCTPIGTLTVETLPSVKVPELARNPGVVLPPGPLLGPFTRQVYVPFGTVPSATVNVPFASVVKPP